MGEDGDIRRRSGRERRAARLRLDVSTEGPRWTCVERPGPAALARRVARAIAAAGIMRDATASATLLLSTDEHVRRLNHGWRGLDKPTNVLSFPSRPLRSPPVPSRDRTVWQPLHLGDIILARQTLEREAADLRIHVADHFRHLVLHGLLHLMGYDHETDQEAEAMEALETRILADLGVSDPYAGTEPAVRRVTPRAGNASGPRVAARRRRVTGTEPGAR